MIWYRFSKIKWVWDVTDGIEYSYAYVKADSLDKAIKRVNSSLIPKRKYDPRGLDVIDKVYIVPMEDVAKVVY
jgi:hypothetical protein